MAHPDDYIVDGIREQEKPVPRWFKNSLLTLLFLCPFYMLYYHIGAPGRSMEDAYDRALAESTRRQFAEIGELQADQATILRFMEKDNWVKVGKIVFKSQCATCHGMSGEGNVGPNLTDDTYKHVRQVQDIAKVIAEGANNNAMPAWGDKLHPNELVLVSAYVANLRGTNVEGGKAAEGIKIAPWPPAPNDPQASESATSESATSESATSEPSAESAAAS